MTIKKLIEKLKKIPQNTIIEIWDENNKKISINEIFYNGNIVIIYTELNGL